MGLYDMSGAINALNQWGAEIAQEKRDKKILANKRLDEIAAREQRQKELEAQRQHQMDLELAKLGVYGANPAQGPTGPAPAHKGTGFFDLYGTQAQGSADVPQEESPLQVEVLGADSPQEQPQGQVMTEPDPMREKHFNETENMLLALSEASRAKTQRKSWTDKLKLRREMANEDGWDVTTKMLEDMTDDEFYRTNNMVDEARAAYQRAYEEATKVTDDPALIESYMNQQYMKRDLPMILMDKFGFEKEDMAEMMGPAIEKFNEVAPTMYKMNKGLPIDSMLRDEHSENLMSAELKKALKTDPDFDEYKDFNAEMKQEYLGAYGDIVPDTVSAGGQISLNKMLYPNALSINKAKSRFQDRLKDMSYDMHKERTELINNERGYRRLKEDLRNNPQVTGFVQGFLTKAKSLVNANDEKAEQIMFDLNRQILQLYKISGKTVTDKERVTFLRDLLPNAMNGEVKNQAVIDAILKQNDADLRDVNTRQAFFQAPLSQADADRMSFAFNLKSMRQEAELIKFHPDISQEDKDAFFAESGPYQAKMNQWEHKLKEATQKVMMEGHDESLLEGIQDEYVKAYMDPSQNIEVLKRKIQDETDHVMKQKYMNQLWNTEEN